ncbi:MAG: hypothetical protein ACE5OW_05965 [Candidatus Bathyarchaeia archaeon]
MLGKDEIVYYLIEHPFKEEKIIVFDRDKILESLNQFKEGMKLRRILHVPQKEDGQKDKLLAVEKSLVEDYEKSSERSKGWIIFSTFGGLALCYLLFKPLFRLGYLPLINFLIRNFKTVTPEIINAYVDPGAQLAALAIGMILGFSPLIFGGVVSYDALKRARRDKKHAELMRKLEKCELEIVENESLASFYKDSTDLIGEIREQAEGLRKIKDRYEKIEPCKRIRDHLEKVIIITKLYELNGVNEHYHRLHDSFYDLENRLKNPRFWRNDEKYMRELLGDSR